MRDRTRPHKFIFVSDTYDQSTLFTKITASKLPVFRLSSSGPQEKMFTFGLQRSFADSLSDSQTPQKVWNANAGAQQLEE
jgi:hypothetical protein